MSQSAHLEIFRIKFKARLDLDSDLSNAAWEASQYLSEARVQFPHCGVEGDDVFVEVERQKIPITLRVLRENGFDPVVECIQGPTVAFPARVRIMMNPRPGRKIEDEYHCAIEDLTVAGLFPLGSGYGAGPNWGPGCATFDVEDFNLETTMRLLRAGGYRVSLDH